MKTCNTCGEAKDLSAFCKSKATKDGLNGRCRACSKEYKRDWHLRHKEAERERSRDYHQLNKEAILEDRRAYYLANPERVQAKRAVNLAVKRGAIVPAKTCDCHDCGQPAAEYHHECYKPEHWLHVVPLCKSCHRTRHSPLTASPHEPLHFVLRPVDTVPAIDASGGD